MTSASSEEFPRGRPSTKPPHHVEEDRKAEARRRSRYSNDRLAVLSAFARKPNSLRPRDDDDDIGRIKAESRVTSSPRLIRPLIEDVCLRVELVRVFKRPDEIKGFRGKSTFLFPSVEIYNSDTIRVFFFFIKLLKYLLLVVLIK